MVVAMTRAVTIECRECGLRVTGVADALGIVRASDRTRPSINAPIHFGYCYLHATAISDDARFDRTPPVILGVKVR
jgi:hypothetical protein